MKTMILSDLHFGAGNSKFFVNDNDKIVRLVDIVIEAEADVLVLAGDVLDFSLCSYHDTVLNARQFFSRLKKTAKQVKQVVYLPGNHDKNIANLLREQLSMIQPMTEGHVPSDTLPYSLMVCMDAATGLPEVYRPFKKIFDQRTFRGKNSMLAGLYDTEEIRENMISTTVAYPNFYLETEKGVYLITHGHFFQVPWSLFSLLWDQTVMSYRRPSEGATMPSFLTVDEIEAVNSPLTELVWASMGQVSQIRDVMNAVYVESSQNQQAETLIQLADEAFANIEKHKLHSLSDGDANCLQTLIEKAALHLANYGLDKTISFFTARGSQSKVPELFAEKVNRYLTEKFLQASAWHYMEIRRRELNGNFAEVFFGHTHHAYEIMNKPDGWLPDVTFRNCGGWVNEPHCHAMAFLVDEKGNITSQVYDI